MNSIHDKLVLSLLMNDDFINFIINPNLILKEMWDEFFYINPEMIHSANEAKAILLGETQTNSLAQFEKELTKNRIFDKCGLSVA